VEIDRVVLSAKQKALRVNLNQDLYGTFAEIGAGQEVVRHFFKLAALPEPLQRPFRPTIRTLVMPFTDLSLRVGMFASHVL